VPERSIKEFPFPLLRLHAPLFKTEVKKRKEIGT